jgi:hypothetical protein
MNSQFLLSSPQVKQFFDTGENPPISELLYLNTHPLILPNFLTEVNDLLEKAGVRIVDQKISGRPIADLIIIGEELKEDIRNLTPETGVRVLTNYRKMYILCKQILEI